jgi:hypothetical protein
VRQRKKTIGTGQKEQATPDLKKAVPKWVGLMTIVAAKTME